jgi:NAD(P)-dependent dehydrogenase (short-subunit alcohol dehydrogenase family)
MSDAAVALITGAAGDIGRATAVVLADAGWRVALTDLPSASEALGRSADECAEHGADVWSETADVTDADAMDRLVRSCGDAFGTPAGVFANAGIQGRFDRVDRYPIDEVRQLLDVNVVGVFTTLSAVSRAMIASGGGGAVVVTASMAGVTGAPNMSAYSATKAAVIGLVKSAAKDLAPAGIRVNAVSPAFIGPGRMWDRQVAAQAATGSQYYATDPATVAEQMVAMIPMRRCGTPTEVGQVVAYLLSDAASYLTGINVEIAGGSV